jgi:hypothetical protein
MLLNVQTAIPVNTLPDSIALIVQIQTVMRAAGPLSAQGVMTNLSVMAQVGVYSVMISVNHVQLDLHALSASLDIFQLAKIALHV